LPLAESGAEREFDLGRFNVLSFDDLVVTDAIIGGRAAARRDLRATDSVFGQQAIFATHVLPGELAYYTLVAGSDAELMGNGRRLHPAAAGVFVGRNLSATSSDGFRSRRSGPCAPVDDFVPESGHCLDSDYFLPALENVQRFQEMLDRLPDTAVVADERKRGIVLECNDANAQSYAVHVLGSQLADKRWWRRSRSCNASAFWTITIRDDQAGASALPLVWNLRGGPGTIPDRTVFNIVPDFTVADQPWPLLNNDTGRLELALALFLRGRRLPGHLFASAHTVTLERVKVTGSVVAGAIRINAGSRIWQPYCRRWAHHGVSVTTLRGVRRQSAHDHPPASATSCTSQAPVSDLFVLSLDGFAAGDTVTIDESLPEAENATVLQLLVVGPDREPALRFAAPLQHVHGPDAEVLVDVAPDEWDARSTGAGHAPVVIPDWPCPTDAGQVSDGTGENSNLGTAAVLGFVFAALFVCATAALIAFVNRSSPRKASSSDSDSSGEASA
jgi:Putative Ice-binding-like adhesive domain